ncbi:MAG: NADH-quinone oxidoreductase subunit J [Candidatus Omnitrophica bacterium]|nr:NADH-quinone oxidoreductase subunit J [Candidatus Omnitrophota bacterium]
MGDFVFYFIALCTCVFSVLAVTQRDIFHCALWLALTLMSISGVYFYLDAAFLGVVQILVYVGGIITLFIFAIKLTAHMNDTSIRQTSKQWVISVFVTLLLLLVLFKVFARTSWAEIILKTDSTSINQIGLSLMTHYALPFEFMSVILLAAMVGAIVIGKEKK